MAIITPPSPLPLRGVKWRLRRPGQRNRSEWTGREQGVILPGASRWLVSGEFPSIVQPAAANPWIAFFLALDGIANSFPLRAVEAQQTTASNPTVSGGGQTGSSLNLAGLSGTTGAMFLPAGARATIPMTDGTAQLVGLTAPLMVGGGGSGTMQFKAPLRAAPANGATVEVRFPYALVALTEPEAGWDVGVGQIYGFAFDAEEKF